MTCASLSRSQLVGSVFDMERDHLGFAQDRQRHARHLNRGRSAACVKAERSDSRVARRVVSANGNSPVVEVYAVDVLEVWREMTNAAALALAKAATASGLSSRRTSTFKTRAQLRASRERETLTRDHQCPWALREARAITRFGDETSCGVRRGHAHELGQRGARQGATHFERAVPLEFVQASSVRTPKIRRCDGIESELCQPHL